MLKLSSGFGLFWLIFRAPCQTRCRHRYRYTYTSMALAVMASERPMRNRERARTACAKTLRFAPEISSRLLEVRTF